MTSASGRIAGPSSVVMVIGTPIDEFMNPSTRVFERVVDGIPTHDPTNNFRLYSRRLLESVEVESEAGFELAIELTVKAHLAGMRVAEVPTTWRDRTAGESRFRLWHWLPHYLRWYRRGISGRLRRPRSS